MMVGVTKAEQIHRIGADLLRRGEDEALSHLASRVVRGLQAEARRFLDRAIGRLAGERRGLTEADRLRGILEAATPPDALSAAPVAPARGPMRLVDNVELLRGGIRIRQGAHGRRLDPLSLMCRRAWLRHEAAGGKAGDFTAPFSPGQISMALHYQALVERHGAAGMKCASAEARAQSGGGNGSGGGFIEAYIEESDKIAAIRRRASVWRDNEGFEREWIALDVRRASASGAGRRPIRAMDLVDLVMLHDADLSEVLRRHGWPKQSAHINALRGSLAQALDRMQGYLQKGY